MQTTAKRYQQFRSGFARFLSNVICGAVRGFLFGLFRVFFRVRMTGRENCPAEGGPLIVASNHIGEWDPPALGSFLPWQTAWIAKIELFEALGGWLSYLYLSLHCVAVDREKVELGLMKECLRIARSRRPLVVFAEGGVRTNEHSIFGIAPELKEGAAAIAIMAGCPVLPVVITGTRSAFRIRNWITFRRPLVEIIIGKPYRIETRDRVAATADLLRRLLELKRELKQPFIC